MYEIMYQGNFSSCHMTISSSRKVLFILYVWNYVDNWTQHWYVGLPQTWRKESWKHFFAYYTLRFIFTITKWAKPVSAWQWPCAQNIHARHYFLTSCALVPVSPQPKIRWKAFLEDTRYTYVYVWFHFMDCSPIKGVFLPAQCSHDRL